MVDYSRSDIFEYIAKLPEESYTAVSTLFIKKESRLTREQVTELHTQILKLFTVYDILKSKEKLVEELKHLLYGEKVVSKGCIDEKLKENPDSDEEVTAALIRSSLG